jgi:hypothetical protein
MPKDQRTAATLSIRGWTTYSADSWDSIERQRWAADLAAAEAPDRALKPHRGRPDREEARQLWALIDQRRDMQLTDSPPGGAAVS